MSSNARRFFEEIVNAPNGYELIKKLPESAEPVLETEWREFKRFPDKPDDAKRLWSKLLSAFANTEGGVVVWGVDARREKGDAIERVRAIWEIADPHVAVDLLQRCLLNATNPPVNGVQIKPVVGESESGFVVCLIPESRTKPHRGESESNYFIRVGDSCVIPSPALLRAMFFPQVRPVIAASVSVTRLGNDADLFRLTAILKNKGMRTANDVVVFVESFGPGAPDAHPGDERIECRSLDGAVQLRLPFSLHPGMRVNLFRFDTHQTDTYLAVKLFADNLPAQRSYFDLSSDEIRDGWEYDFDFDDHDNDEDL